MKSAQGLEISGSDTGVVDCIDHFHQQILSSGKEPDKILQAAQHFPECTLIQIYSGIVYLYAQEDTATKIAENYFKQALMTLGSANTREKLLYQAAIAWSQLDYESAINVLTSILHSYPQDTLSLKFAEWMFYCSGQAWHAPAFLNLCDGVALHHQNDPHFLAIHSFALELNGRFWEAKTMAEKALQIELTTPWAHHSLAHVYLMTNRMEEGLNFLEGVQSSWENVFTLLKSHNTWHLALFYLAKLNSNELHRLFNTGIFGTLPASAGEQIDAISLLWRMDMAGIGSPELYQKISPHLQEHPFEFYTGFNSAHFIYALTRAGKIDQARDALKRMESQANIFPSIYTQNIWRDINLPFCQFVFAFSQEDYAEAAALGAPIVHNCFQLGGSDAQDELFLQTYLVSLLASNKKDEAVKFFDTYLSHYANTNLAAYWFD
jgi:pentatricopeptide repeat protein